MQSIRIAGRPEAVERRLERHVWERVGGAELVEIERIRRATGSASCRSVARSTHQLDLEGVRQHEVGRARHVREGAPVEPRVHQDRRRPLVAFGEVRVKRADLDDFAARAPAQRIDGMAAGREQVAPPARARATHSQPGYQSVTRDRYCVRAKRMSPSQPDSRSQRANFRNGL